MPMQSRSIKNLAGVHPDLSDVMKEVMRVSPIVVAIVEGIRTEQDHIALIAAGACRPGHSGFMRQADGFGHAVRVAGVVRSKLRGDMSLLFRIAAVIRDVAVKRNVGIKWGWNWHPVVKLPDEIDCRIPCATEWADPQTFQLYNIGI